jgi:hypothetical protein
MESTMLKISSRLRISAKIRVALIGKGGDKVSLIASGAVLWRKDMTLS